jgi:hypothetical protein
MGAITSLTYRCALKSHSITQEKIMNHTPAPWHVEIDEYGLYRIREAAHEQDTWVFEGYEQSDEEGDRRSNIAAEHDEGNRRMIEAAPRLLAELKRMVENFGASSESMHGDLVLEQARAAIAEAKGGES